MTKSESPITHEEYFRKYNLNVEQYGEILVALAYAGVKKPDNHKGYDVEAEIDGKPAKIEVKSKQKKGASVLHCGQNKFDPKVGMTHLVVILVERDKKSSPNSVAKAWLLTRKQASELRRMKTKSKYINVHRWAKEEDDNCGAKISVREKLQKAAQSYV